jgi:DNA-binding NtrC family response regulator
MAATPQAETTAQPRILLIEDKARLRSAAELFLRVCGCAVVVATEEAEAMRLLADTAEEFGVLVIGFKSDPGAASRILASIEQRRPAMGVVSWADCPAPQRSTRFHALSPDWRPLDLLDAVASAQPGQRA